jgi:hypothetical protein
MAVRERAQAGRIKEFIPDVGGGVEHHEIIAQAMHLQKLDAHTQA